jgi:DNA-binding CsgD family transcriptional regulator
MGGKEAPRTGSMPDEEIVGKDPPAERQTGAEEPTAPMNSAPAVSDPPSASSASPPPSAVAPSPPASPSPSPRRAPSPEYVQLVYSAKVQKIIKDRLVNAGFGLQDREDLQQVINEGLLYMSNPPADLDGCGRAANDITGKKIAGQRRQGYRRREVVVGPTDQADNHPEIDSRDLATGHHAQRMATLEEAMSDGTLTDRDAQMLSLKREGFADAQIAEKLGVAQQTVSNRIAMARKRVREKWQKRLVKITAFALGVVLVLFAWRKREEVAHLFRDVPPAPAPGPSSMPPQLEPSIPVAIQQAAELRRLANEACHAGYFTTCSEQLEAAAKLDPAGETQPLVRQLRHQVEDRPRGTGQVGAKPGTP